ncbi:hypothetical protein CDEST_04257 [Colletotrichum destructivum]|uniref:Major facilitator superfamily transporter n=1 Tax=Colletotrichum destructivum TaxID=34406 RepID=A0AAX4I8K0_9PEZI|nr:hypothetical protein CDEST_04257 [Colletotrichum destructivum]
MERRDASPARSGDDWGKLADEEDVDIDNGLALETEASSRDREEASKFLLASHSVYNNHKARPSRRSFTTSYPVLAIIVLSSLLLGALTSTALTALVSHIRNTSSSSNPSTAHRNDNTLASPSHDNQTAATYLLPAPCGTSPSQARAAGCLFDLVSFNWLPPQCHDAELAASFEADLRSAGHLAWYEDPRGARPIPRARVATGEVSGVYVSLGYHLRHCTAMWRRMHRALMQGGGGLGRVDGYIWSYHHTRHCEEMLLEAAFDSGSSDDGDGGGGGSEMAVYSTEVRIKYPDCGVVLAS